MIRLISEDIDKSGAVRFNSSMKDLVKQGSIFFSPTSETYEVEDVWQAGRSIYVTLNTIEDSPSAKYSSIEQKLYSYPVSKLYGMMFIE
jgi:hypothetical protein